MNDYSDTHYRVVTTPFRSPVAYGELSHLANTCTYDITIVLLKYNTHLKNKKKMIQATRHRKEMIHPIYMI